MLEWIVKNYKQIWGYGSYIENESGLYVVIPVSLIAEEFSITTDQVIYGDEC